jgi:hypothetical protein
MATLIKEVRNNNRVEFDSGKFDEWCVYLKRHNSPRYAPKDNEYFAALYLLGKTYGHKKIYNDYLKVYALTDKNINPQVLNLITLIADTYNQAAEEIDIWFTVIYAGMVAEENKAYAILKKRIKRLGMHQVLIEQLDASYAANFSKGKGWRDLDSIMRQRGF